MRTRSLAVKSEHIIIGLMSGTSLDGIDAAVVRIQGAGVDSRADMIAFHCKEYDEELRERLKRLCTRGGTSTEEICIMNAYLGEMLAQAACEAASKAGISMEGVDFISSHGQTIWHQPIVDKTDRCAVPSTLQIGDISIIAKHTGVPAIGDYRPADMAVGGQGAPLTPYADYLLLRDSEVGRIAQNIGGIGNCTILPAGGDQSMVTAFDTGPGNMLIDQAIYQLSGGAYGYDRNGEWASRGQVNTELLDDLLAHPYYAEPPVKTTGREMFGTDYALQWIEHGRMLGLSAEDIVATFTALTARTIADAYRQFVFPQHRIRDVIVSGGGACNATLMRWLAEELPEQNVTASDEMGLPGDAKEAIAFALLANDFIHGVPNNLPRVTGAVRPTIMGKLAMP